jgi:hypothetical protein
MDSDIESNMKIDPKANEVLNGLDSWVSDHLYASTVPSSEKSVKGFEPGAHAVRKLVAQLTDEKDGIKAFVELFRMRHSCKELLKSELKKSKCTDTRELIKSILDEVKRDDSRKPEFLDGTKAAIFEIDSNHSLTLAEKRAGRVLFTALSKGNFDDLSFALKKIVHLLPKPGYGSRIFVDAGKEMGLEIFLNRKGSEAEFSIQGSRIALNHSLSLRVFPNENVAGKRDIEVVQALYDGDAQEISGRDQLRSWYLSLLREAKRFKK